MLGYVKIKNKPVDIPESIESLKMLPDVAGVRLPKALPNRGIKVTTKKKL